MLLPGCRLSFCGILSALSVTNSLTAPFPQKDVHKPPTPGRRIHLCINNIEWQHGLGYYSCKLNNTRKTDLLGYKNLNVLLFAAHCILLQVPSLLLLSLRHCMGCAKSHGRYVLPTWCVVIPFLGRWGRAFWLHSSLAHLSGEQGPASFWLRFSNRSQHGTIIYPIGWPPGSITAPAYIHALEILEASFPLAAYLTHI